MHVHFGLPPRRVGPAALTVGSFDGVHLGHQSVLDRLTAAATEEHLLRSWITFDPHPRCVLDPANCPPQISTLEEKLAAIESLGIELAVVMNFTPELAALEAQDFMAQLLAAIDLKALVVGPDFALGRARAGDLQWLRAHGAQHGYRVVTTDPYELDGEEVHSSDVRRLLNTGEVAGAARLLGRHFSLAGLVEPGHRIGRTLGFPTLNLAVPPGKLIPCRGIYAGWALTPGGTYQAALSIGYRPTFSDHRLHVEAYLLDYSGDLYQQQVEIRFVARLRDEVRYDSPELLAAQIARDVDDTRRVLAAGVRP